MDWFQTQISLKKTSKKRFVTCATLVEEYVECMENRDTRKTKQDEQPFKNFLRIEKNEEREVHTIAPAKLNKHLT